MRLLARAGGYNIDVAIYFGDPKPTAAMRRAADERLARLVVPGCPRGAARVARHELGRPPAQRRRGCAFAPGEPPTFAAPSRSGARRARRGRSAARVSRECGAAVLSRVVEVTVTLRPHAYAFAGRRPLRFLVVQRDGDWELWRPG